MGIDAEMFVRTRQPLTEPQVRELAWEMAEAFGPQKFWIFKPEKGRDYVRRALEIVPDFDQDGPTIRPLKGEQFIRVAPSTRYYGEGYERGDLPFLIALAEWLEIRIPAGAVWYGGDSSGVKAAPFDAITRTMLFRHFALVGHRPYNGDPRGKGDKRDFLGMGNEIPQPFCDFCEQPMRQNGYGMNYGGFYCCGCGEKRETRDNGQTWTNPKDSD